MKKLRSGYIKKSSPSSQGTKRGEGRIIDVLTSSSPLAAPISHRRV